MMYDRYVLSRTYLELGGCIATQISDHEDGRLNILLESIFGEDFVNKITVKTRSPSGFKTVNLGVFESAEYIYVYANDKSKVEVDTDYTPAEHDENYKYFVSNKEQPVDMWDIVLIPELLAQQLGYKTSREARRSLGKEAFKAKFSDFAIENAHAVFRLAAIDSSSASQETIRIKNESSKDPERVFIHHREHYDDRYILKGQEMVFYDKKVREIDGKQVNTLPVTNIWTDIPWEGLSTEGRVTFPDGKKPEKLLRRLLTIFTQPESIIIDYFSGSGTTAAVSQKMSRKWLCVESDHNNFDIALQRIQHVMYGDSGGFKGSKSGGIIKYISVESYEDTLNNLRWNRTPQQQKLLWDEGKDEFREDYMLRYMLDVEAKGSASLLDMKQFINPFAYQLEIGTGTVGETHPVTIDLVETFNYLLGLHVRRVQTFDHIRTVEGENRDGQQVLVIWCNREEIDNEALDAFFLELGGLEAEFDLIYVNGDNHLENLKKGKEVWQVRLIEPTFHQLMFDVQDV